jgi:mannose-6-phosphate isomerase-like protein (cupin superfamily)
MEMFNEKERQFRGGDSGPKYLSEGPFWDGGIIIFKPGQTLGEHWHAEIEETFYVISGTSKMSVDLKEFRISSGDVIKVSKGERHNIINDSDRDLNLFFVKAPFRPKDKFTI